MSHVLCTEPDGGASSIAPDDNISLTVSPRLDTGGPEAGAGAPPATCASEVTPLAAFAVMNTRKAENVTSIHTF